MTFEVEPILCFFPYEVAPFLGEPPDLTSYVVDVLDSAVDPNFVSPLAWEKYLAEVNVLVAFTVVHMLPPEDELVAYRLEGLRHEPPYDAFWCSAEDAYACTAVEVMGEVGVYWCPLWDGDKLLDIQYDLLVIYSSIISNARPRILRRITKIITASRMATTGYPGIDFSAPVSGAS